MPRKPTGRVDRVAEDEARGRMTLQGSCSCGWKGNRIEAKDHRSVELNAPATAQAAREVTAHFHAKHPELMTSG